MIKMVAYVVVISIAVDGALLLSATGERSWTSVTVAVFSVALISAGILFTVLEMLRLGRSRPQR
jgi:hypothetical protein